MPTHRYKQAGPSTSALSSTLGSAVTKTLPTPLETMTLTIADDAYLADLDVLMAAHGWARDETVPVSFPACLQIQKARLSADAAPILPSAWTDVLSVNVTTEGGSALHIHASCPANVVVGGSLRALINGGAFSNEVLQTAAYPLVSSNAPGVIMTYVDLPAGAQTYTIQVQASASALGSVTPRIGSALIAEEVV